MVEGREYKRGVGVMWWECFFIGSLLLVILIIVLRRVYERLGLFCMFIDVEIDV